MKISDNGIDLIKAFEGCELEAYQCSADVWTIGYGHTRGVSEGDVFSQEDADTTLRKDLEEFESYVSDLVTIPLTQYQFDALVSWTFNLGPTNLGESTMLTRINDSKFLDVPYEIQRWNKAGGKVVAGLARRRAAEAKLFQGQSWS